LRSCDIKRIVDTYKNRVSIPKYSKVVSLEEIRKNEYNLNIPRYVDSSEKAESFDIFATMNGGIPNNEIEELNNYWDEFTSLKNELFEKDNDFYSSSKTNDVDSVFDNNTNVISFRNNFTNKFTGFDSFLREKLVNNFENISIPLEEENITNEIFIRFNNIPLIDKYNAYQIFSEKYNEISIDIEVLQTEGKESLTKVIPNMVIKKTNGKEEEKQDGWKGLILPFELVQKELLSTEVNEINELNNKVNEITSQYEEYLDQIPEDEKNEILNEENTAFDFKAVKKIVKEAKGQPLEDGSIEQIATFVDKLNEEEKRIKKELKEKTASLYLLTKKTIEELDFNKALELLDKKWNEDIVTQIMELPNKLLSELKAKITYLTNKYKETLCDIDENIQSSSKELNALIDELEGGEFDMKGLADLKKLLGGE